MPPSQPPPWTGEESRLPPRSRGGLGWGRCLNLTAKTLINAPYTHARHATLRSPLSKPQHGFSPNPNPLFIQRNPTSSSQRCHTFNNNTANGTGNCHPSVPSETACTQNAIGARDLPRLVRLECPRTIITKNTRAPPHPTTRTFNLHPQVHFTPPHHKRRPSPPRALLPLVLWCPHLVALHPPTPPTRRRPLRQGAPARVLARAHTADRVRHIQRAQRFGVASPVADTQQ